jgi:aspartate kinase
MGVLNVTPDSFYDGGSYPDAASAVEAATKMVSEGAHIIDIGGESSRPFAEPVSLKEELERGRIVIVAGFQGVSSQKEVTTLGRGGSDTTGVALAAAFGACECGIFTDVDGVFTADPSAVPRARKIERISYDEMLELSFCGAQVLHWRSVEVARRFGVKVHVRSSFKQERGTLVLTPDEIEPADIRGISHDTGVAMIRIGCPEKALDAASGLLEILQEGEVTVRFLTVCPATAAPGSISVVVPQDQAESASRRLREAMPRLETAVDTGIATVSVVGQGLASKPGIARQIFATLAALGIEPDLVSTSGMTLTLALDEARLAETVRQLHEDLGLGGPTRT